MHLRDSVKKAKATVTKEAGRSGGGGSRPPSLSGAVRLAADSHPAAGRSTQPDRSVLYGPPLILLTMPTPLLFETCCSQSTSIFRTGFLQRDGNPRRVFIIAVMLAQDSRADRWTSKSWRSFVVMMRHGHATSALCGSWFGAQNSNSNSAFAPMGISPAFA